MVMSNPAMKTIAPTATTADQRVAAGASPGFLVVMLTSALLLPVRTRSGTAAG